MRCAHKKEKESKKKDLTYKKKKEKGNPMHTHTFKSQV